MIIHPIILVDPREAATYHLRTAIVDGGARPEAVFAALRSIWPGDGDAYALYGIWSARRRHSLDHASIPQEAPHAAA